MKPLLTALILSVAATPVIAQGYGGTTLFPSLTYPEPAPDTVTQGEVAIEN